jgi:hypothetical protein
VPRDEGGVARLLPEEARRPAENVRAEDVLDRVEHGRMPHEIGKPRQQEMGLLVGGAAELAALGRRQRLDLGAHPGRGRLVHHPQREQNAVALVGLDRFRCELLHRLPPQWLNPTKLAYSAAWHKAKTTRPVSELCP